MGPEVVVKHIPLQITGKEESYEFPRSWLLPVLRENIQNANLAFFKTYFLPMAMACQARAAKAENENDKIGQKSYEMLVSQIWSLLPGTLKRCRICIVVSNKTLFMYPFFQDSATIQKI